MAPLTEPSSLVLRPGRVSPQAAWDSQPPLPQSLTWPGARSGGEPACSPVQGESSHSQRDKLLLKIKQRTPSTPEPGSDAQKRDQSSPELQPLSVIRSQAPLITTEFLSGKSASRAPSGEPAAPKEPTTPNNKTTLPLQELYQLKSFKAWKEGVFHQKEFAWTHLRPLQASLISGGEDTCRLVSRMNSSHWLPGGYLTVLIVGGARGLCVAEDGCGAFQDSPGLCCECDFSAPA
ncbi:uncharacterized protein LOC134470368 [Cavia porcellus]|uniref:uncharacterized protein LOC134470368 n=1 Tax=Cavia porcellus TaxID=10141 RepID=UPI002FE0684C